VSTGELFRADVDQVHLQLMASLEVSQQEVGTAPERFGGLEIRVLQQRTHRIAETCIDGGDKIVFLRARRGVHERPDHALQQATHRRVIVGTGRRAAGEPCEVAELGTTGRRAATRSGAPREARSRRPRVLGPGHDLGGRRVELRRVVEAFPQRRELCEERHIGVDPVGMKRVDVFELERHRCAVLPERQGELELQAPHRIFERVELHLERLAFAECRTRLEPTLAGTGAEVAEQRDAQRALGIPRGRRRADGSEIGNEAIAHDLGSFESFNAKRSRNRSEATAE